MRIVLDATALTCWHRCREEFRRTYLENLASAQVAVHREFGIGLHIGVENLWRGFKFEGALMAVHHYLQSVPEDRIPSADKRKWEELKAMAPTMLATYSDSVSTDPEKVQIMPHVKQPLLEYEWQLPEPFGIQGMLLTGRIDRVERRSTTTGSASDAAKQPGPVLVDVKTASEIDGTDEMGKKVGWERTYRAQMAKDIGLGLYDWYLRQIGLEPKMVCLEVILKPSDRYGKKCRVVRLEMPEVLAYRERFDSTLEFTLREIKQYVQHYSKMNPWPMNPSACSGKFGNCHFLALCNAGLNPRTEKLYRERQEYLSIQGRRIEL